MEANNVKILKMKHLLTFLGKNVSATFCAKIWDKIIYNRTKESSISVVQTKRKATKLLILMSPS